MFFGVWIGMYNFEVKRIRKSPEDVKSKPLQFAVVFSIIFIVSPEIRHISNTKINDDVFKKTII